MRLTLKVKLGVTFAVVVALSGVSMFIAIQNLGSLNDAVTGIVQGNVARTAIASEINARTLRIARDEKNFIIASEAADMEELGKAIREQEAALREDVARLRELSGDEGKTRVDSFTAAWDKFMGVHYQVEDFARLNSGTLSRRMVQTEGVEAFAAALEPITGLADTLEQSIANGGESEFARYKVIADLKPVMLEVRANVLNTIASADNPDDQARYATVVEEKMAAVRAQLDAAGKLLFGADRKNAA